MLTRITPAALAIAVLSLTGIQALAQTADFVATTATEGCFPLTVKFDDTSTGTITSRLWKFGNGNTSTEENPEVIFTAPGVYDISLTVSNGGSPSTRIRSGYIVVHDLPSVDFSFDKSSGCAPLTVKFSDKTSTASGKISGWFWVFGDGATSTSANPTHTYETPGPKIVSLSVRNEFGCVGQKSTETAITIQGPTAKFKSDKAAACTFPATFTFTNESTGSNLTYEWTFGDGQTSTATNPPPHTYTQKGKYHVELKARDAGGCVQTFSMEVNVGSEGDLDFSITLDDVPTNKVCLGVPIKFKLESDFAPTSVNWKFGDGDEEGINDPSHTYAAPGTYTVTLEAHLLGHTCNSIIEKQVLVATPAIPSFTFDIGCDYKLTLTSTSQNTSRVEWYIEDENAVSGKVVVSPFKRYGLQHIRLRAFDAAGCASETEQDVFVPPNPSVRFEPNIQQTCDPTEKSLSGCAPFFVTFENKTTFTGNYTLKWEFGDGGTSTSKTTVSHVYQNKGLYQLAVTATTDRGCTVTEVAFVLVDDQAPLAEFTISENEVCAGFPITFTATEEADTYCWDFGDGETGTGEIAVHKYKKPGTYDVKLIAKNAGCATEKNVIAAVKVKDPEINFEWSKSCVDPYKLSFNNLSKNFDPGTIHWRFGDGATSDDVNPLPHVYAAQGRYTVEMDGFNSATQCLVTASDIIIIQEVKADFEVNTDKPCKDAPLIFTDKSNAAATWEWDIATQSFDVPSPQTKVRTPGDYVATLKAIDTDGCFDIKSIPIKVLDMEGNFVYAPPVSNCDELSVVFENLSTGTPEPTAWIWDFGDGETSTDENPTHVYDALGTYAVTLSVTSADGTCVFSKDDAIVFTNPVPAFETAKTEFCIGDLVQVANTTTDAVKYEWDYGDGTRTDFFAPSIVYEDTGAYDISLFAIDQYGCEKKLVKEEFVIIEKPTADFTVASPSGACPPFTAVFSDQSESNIEEWDWDFGDGQESLIKDPANVYLKPGTFNVTLTVKDDNGCTNTVTKNQFVQVGGPSGSFAFSGNSQCTNDIFSFSANVTNAVVLRWDFGDGNVETGSGTLVSHSYSVGSYTPALLLVDAQGCQVIADGSTLLQVHDTTAVAVAIAPGCIKVDEPFTITGSAENENDFVTWTWAIDGVSAGSGESLDTSLDKPGMHTVTGFATNQFNCVSHTTDTVRIQGPISMIPNVITPNGDGVNQSFNIIGLENSTWNIDILNRWGNTVYKKNDYKGDWDGDEQPAGVYYFVLRNAVCDDRDYKGYISIVR